MTVPIVLVPAGHLCIRLQRLLIPTHGLSFILWQTASAVLVHDTQIIHAGRIAGFCRFLEPTDRLGIILWQQRLRGADPGRTCPRRRSAIELGALREDQAWWEVPLPPCPDCGGDLVWHEAGYTPERGNVWVSQLRTAAYSADGGCGSFFDVEPEHGV